MKNPFYNQERIFLLSIKKDTFYINTLNCSNKRKKNQQKICGLKKFLYLRKIFRQKKNNV